MQVLQSLIDARFPAIYPVNPRYTSVLGLPCYPSLKDIPGVVDHVVVGIPAESALALLDECAAKGVRSVHFFTAGFGESGYAERSELEKALLSKAEAGGFRIIGPNCVGLYVPRNRLINGLGMPLEPGPISFISQSGGNAHDLPYYGVRRGLRFCKVVSYGNALDVNESELLQYLAEDQKTSIIAAYIEGVKDGARFRKALEKATDRKPVVIYKGGNTSAGNRTTRGHTASLTTSTAVFHALSQQTNTIQVDDMGELTDALVALHFVNPLPQGLGVAVVGMGGGPSVLAGDVMEEAGLHLPPLSPETQAQLKQFLPLAGGIFGNPIDATSLLTPKAIESTMDILSKLPDIDMLVYHLGFHPVSYWGDGRFSSSAFLDPVIKAFTEIRQTAGKPVLLALRPAPDMRGTKEFLTAQEAFVCAGVPVFYSLRQLAKAAAKIVVWKQREVRNVF